MNDVEYTNENAEKLLNEYTGFVDKQLQKFGVGHLEVLESVFLPTEVADGADISPAGVSKKYGIVGAILGGTVGILIVAGLAMRKISND